MPMQSRFRDVGEGVAIQGDNANSVRAPWIERPFELLSWWDMERFSADRLYLIGAYLQVLTKALENDTNEDYPLDPDARRGSLATTIVTVNSVHEECAKIGLKVAVRAAEHLEQQIVEFINHRPSGDIGLIRHSIEELSNIITWEMQDQTFLHVPADRAKRYGIENAFGEMVSSNFHSASFDIKEAGNCYAAGRFTACVFHVMRVLEVGLVAFARRFPGVDTGRENWQQIVDKIQSAISDLPKQKNKPSGWKEIHEKNSQIASGFMFFKDAWRNYTAHARGKYIEEEADAIYRNVCSFMQKLAENGIHEQTEGNDGRATSAG